MSLIPWRNKRESRDIERRSETGLGRLRTEIDTLFDRFMSDFWGDRLESRFAPLGLIARTDLTESADDVTVKVELPGVDPKDIDIRLEGTTLTISGEKKQETEEKNRNYRYVERQFGSFQRSLQLPSYVDPDHVEAKMKDGILTITLAKRADVKPKEILVKPAEK